MKTSYVYMITNENNRVLYVGVTSDLIRRIYEHKNKLFDGFSSKYNLGKLVYYIQFEDIATAIEAEKKMKKWSRTIKERKIRQLNPGWNDLYDEIL